MSDKLEKLKALRQQLEAKMRNKQPGGSLFDTISQTSATEPKTAPVPNESSLSHLRNENLRRLKTLFYHLKIDRKHNDFDTLFHFKAMNLSGIGLKEEDFGEIRPGKYIQIITIDYEPDKNGKKRAKNKSLAYFGKAENVDAQLKHDIIEFVLRWRYEKAIQNVLHYEAMLEKLSS
jgi:hypothetical protein